MAYNTEELEKMALEAIAEHQLIYNDDIIAFLPCCKETFYNHKLNESDSIKKAIFAIKTSIKAELRKDWRTRKNSTTDLALYKLLANEDELQRLSVQKLEHTGKEGGPIETKQDLTKLSLDELEKLAETIAKIGGDKSGDGSEEL